MIVFMYPIARIMDTSVDLCRSFLDEKGSKNVFKGVFLRRFVSPPIMWEIQFADGESMLALYIDLFNS